MEFRISHKSITYCIASVWIVNGLFCKVLNLVPRHQEIVQRITNLNQSNANLLTFIIGVSEIVIAIWIISGYKSNLNAIFQIIIVAIINIIEFMVVPDLLLWGKLNSIFAFLFILIVYYNEFIFNKKTTLIS